MSDKIRKIAEKIVEGAVVKGIEGVKLSKGATRRFHFHMGRNDLKKATDLLVTVYNNAQVGERMKAEAEKAKKEADKKLKAKQAEAAKQAAEAEKLRKEAEKQAEEAKKAAEDK